MTTQSKFVAVALLVIAGIAGLSAARILRHSGAAPLELTTGTYLAPSRPLPEFSLIDHHERAFGIDRLRGRWSLLFFGYTNCPDFCPTTLTILGAMQRHIPKSEVHPQVVFVSVDAKRDTPMQLAKYVPYFDPEFLGVTAKDQQTIDEFTRKLGVPVYLHPPLEGNYIVDHSAAIFVIDPQGQFTALLTGPFTAPALEADFARIVAAHSSARS